VRWSLHRWAAWTTFAAALLSMAAIVAGGSAIISLTNSRNTLVDRLDPAVVAALRLSNALLNEEAAVRGFALSAQDESLAPYTEGQATAQNAVATLRRLFADGFTQATDDLDNVLRASRAWDTGFAQPTIAAIRASRQPASAGGVRTDQQLFDSVQAALDTQSAHLRVAHNRARAQLADAATWLLWSSVGIAVALIAGAVALSIVLRRGVITPIATLRNHVRVVATGELGHVVQVDGPAEVTELGADVESMRQRILAELSALRAAHSTLDLQARDLERSNAELEQFAYVASHDLQEPLRKVASFCQLLEARYHDTLDERGRQYIDFAVDGATRMQALINDLLAFSRVGRLNEEMILLDGNDLLAAARSNLASAIEDSAAVIEADPLPALQGDPPLLIAVWQNLIANAIKFRNPDRPPRIRLTAAREADHWRFSCADNGIGIAPEYADRIFVIFQRLHPKSAYPGTGIGLAMCRKIVEYHGGRIWLDTTVAGPDGGTRICFTLPRVADDTAGDTVGAADRATDSPSMAQPESGFTDD
jgi:signal transduction histidine kinase